MAESNDQPRPLRFGHVLLMVEDIDRSTDFYVGGVGFTTRPAKPLADGRDFTAFHHGFALIAGKEKSHQQVDHIAFEVDDVRALNDRLKARGTHFQEDLHDGPYGLTIYVSDPDGNRIELYQVGLKA
ncbi:MAG: VOC family protein [Proteobacteria bacterium]|nr:VOC family protein [Pseudomonadota bacterium]